MYFSDKHYVQFYNDKKVSTKVQNTDPINHIMK